MGASLKPVPPSKDDFYTLPEGYKGAEVGDILKIRKSPFPPKAISLPTNVANMWQALVRSEDALGNATAIVTTIIEPYEANSSRVVSYQIAEDAVSNDCSPSFTLQGAGGFGALVGQAETFLIQSVLDLGYYVVVPDFQGLDSYFGVAKMAGHSVLNSVRAALKSGNVTEIDPNAEVVLWGYSGGSLASSWAAILQPDYAEDLSSNLKGAACGGWLNNVTAFMELVDETLFTGIAVNMVYGITLQYPKFKEFVRDQISDSDRYKKYLSATNTCVVQTCLEFLYDGIFSGPNRYFKDGLKIFDDPLVKSVMDDQNIGGEKTKNSLPEIPMFLFQGVKDEVVPFEPSLRIYNDWCEQGIGSLEFAASNTTGHFLEALEGSGAAVKWISERFEGKEPIKGCDITYRSTNLLYPGAITTGVWHILSGMGHNILGDKIGPIDSETFLKGMQAQGIDTHSFKKRDPIDAEALLSEIRARGVDTHAY